MVSNNFNLISHTQTVTIVLCFDRMRHVSNQGQPCNSTLCCKGFPTKNHATSVPQSDVPFRVAGCAPCLLFPAPCFCFLNPEGFFSWTVALQANGGARTLLVNVLHGETKTTLFRGTKCIWSWLHVSMQRSLRRALSLSHIHRNIYHHHMSGITLRNSQHLYHASLKMYLTIPDEISFTDQVGSEPYKLILEPIFVRHFGLERHSFCKIIFS